MKKLRLDLEQITVDTFATTGGAHAERGTVKGNVMCACCCCDPCCCTCCNTCQATCPNTCADTCPATCQATCPASCYGTCVDEYTCWDSCGRTQCCSYDYVCETYGAKVCLEPLPY